MMNKPLCPILTIGFNPPEEGQHDLRRCTKECALFDEDNAQCSIRTCAEKTNYVAGAIDEIIDNLYNQNSYTMLDENYDYDANSKFV